MAQYTQSLGGRLAWGALLLLPTAIVMLLFTAATIGGAAFVCIFNENLDFDWHTANLPWVAMVAWYLVQYIGMLGVYASQTQRMSMPPLIAWAYLLKWFLAQQLFFGGVFGLALAYLALKH